MEIQSEVRPKLTSFKKPPQGKVIILPNGVIDDRHQDDRLVIEEQFEEYDNFDRNSYFASSLDDHDKKYDEQKEKMASSLGGWY